MSSRGITITTYLKSGHPEGISLSYLSNWTGQAIKIPRNLFIEAQKLEELNRPGVYLLIGYSEDNFDDKLIYVGEANQLNERITTHIKNSTDKSWVDLIIAFSSKDDNLTVSHTKYLESKLIEEAVERSGLTFMNKKVGNRINLPKMVADEMDTYFENMKILLPMLGIEIFKSYNGDQKPSLVSNDDKLFLEVGDIKATAKLISNGLLILKGSHLKETIASSLTNNHLKIRQDLLDKGIIVSNGGSMIFTDDYVFSSPSQAGAIILGYSVNGRSFWKNKQGKTLKDIEEDKLKFAV